MSHRRILDYIEQHYDEFPNFDGRAPAEVLIELPDQDARYGQDDLGLQDLLNEIDYR